MAGGILGGLLGGMLFSSLGFAGGTGGFGGGFGLMDLLLLAGIAYLIYWFVRRGRARQEAALAGARCCFTLCVGGCPVENHSPRSSRRSKREITARRST